MKLAILGAGAWGSALAVSFAGAHDVALWARHEADRRALAASRHTRYFPEVAIPEAVAIVDDLDGALRGAELALIAASTAGLRDACARIAAAGAAPALLWACKGFEPATGKLPHEVVAEVLGRDFRAGALSGPSFAMEVARGLPTALVAAAPEAPFAAGIAAALNSARLRIYSSTDVMGVELGGAVKNVIAIAAGIADGLGLGHNARAALITRGLAEIVRLGTALGGRGETFMGLAGLGDLVLTCTGQLSRNREVGVRLAGGRPLAAILEALGHVAEGVHSATEVRKRARALGVDMPIVEAVCGVLFEGAAPEAAVRQLLAREPRAE